MNKITADLKALAQFAKKKGFTVQIKSDHIVASKESGTIRTGSMTTLKKLVG